MTVDSNVTTNEYVGYLANIATVTQVEVTANTDINISTITPNMTIIGCGFQETVTDVSLASKNVLTFNMSSTVNGNEYPVRGYVSKTTDNTVTKMIIVFSMLSPVNSGYLYIKVQNEAAGYTSDYTIVAHVTSESQYIEVSNSTLSSASVSLILTGHGFDGYPSSNRNAFQLVAENSNTYAPLRGEITSWSFSQLKINFNALSPLNYGSLTCRIGIVCTDVSDITTCNYITNETNIAYIVASVALLDTSTTQIGTDITESLTVLGKGFDAKYVFLFSLGLCKTYSSIRKCSRLLLVFLFSFVFRFDSCCHFNNLNTNNQNSYLSNNNITFSTGNSDWIVLSQYDCTLSTAESIITTEYDYDSDECLDLCNTTTSCVQYVHNTSTTNSTCVLYESTSMSVNILPTLSSASVTCGYLRPDIYVTITTSTFTTLVMTFNQFGPIHASSGEIDLTLTVNVNGSPGNSDVTTVALISAKTIDISDSKIDTINTLSSLVTIHGTGFDDTFPRYNEVEFSNPSLVSGYVMTSSRTTLVMSLWSLSYSLSTNINCKVHHYLRNVPDMTSLSGISSAETVCFQVNLTDPVVTESTNMVMIDTSSLTISGQGFDTNTSSNTIVFTTRSGETFTKSECVEASRTRLVINMSNTLTSTYWGNISAVVSIKGRDSQDYNSSYTVVSDLRIVRPTITSDTSCTVTTSDKNVTLYGFEFDIDVEQNNVTCYVACTDSTTSIVTNVDVLGAASSVTMSDYSATDSMVFDFYNLAPRYSGCDMYFNVQVASNPYAPNISLACYDDSVDCTTSTSSQVCTIVSADPTIDENATLLSVNTKMLTVTGSGFDATYLGNNMFSFNSSSSQYEVTATVHTASSTSLVLTFDHLSLYNVGNLSAFVKVLDGDSNTVNSSAYVNVAQITPAIPTIDENCNLLYTNTESITIRGSGFEAYGTFFLS